MGRCIDSGRLSKQYILKNVSQERIFSTYLNIPVSVIQDCAYTGNLIKSPMRDDRHPTVGFRYNSDGILKMRDFAGYFWGDCFDLAAIVLKRKEKAGIDVKNGKNFIDLLKFITVTFGSIFYGREKDDSIDGDFVKSLSEFCQTATKIEVVTRDWNVHDISYWNRRGVSLKYLNISLVYPIEQYYVNREMTRTPKYFYDRKNPCYAYLLGYSRKRHVQNIKLYFPMGEKGDKFITNCSCLEGVINLDAYSYDIVCITKSTKDRLVLGSMLFRHDFLYRGQRLDIGVINVPCETYNMTESELEWIKGRMKPGGRICSLMDNDRTGKAEALKLRREYGIVPLLIPERYGAKDFDELYVRQGEKVCHEIMAESIGYLMERKGLPVEKV